MNRRSPIEKNNVLLEGRSELTSSQKKLFKYFGQGSRIKPPYRILNPGRIQLGDRTSIQEHAHINAFLDLSFLKNYIEKKYRSTFDEASYRYDPEIVIGRECQIGRFFFVSCTSKIVLRDNVLVSERVFIGDNNHSFAHPMVPIMQQPNSRGGSVEIGEGSWIGVGAALLRGTQLGRNSVVGANSVVDRKFPAHVVIAPPKAKLWYVKKPLR